MNLSLDDMALPLRLQPGIRMTDEQLLQFCAANDDLRIERNTQGELIVMSPAEAAAVAATWRSARI